MSSPVPISKEAIEGIHMILDACESRVCVFQQGVHLFLPRHYLGSLPPPAILSVKLIAILLSFVQVWPF